jgi:hypothetical protein
MPSKMKKTGNRDNFYQLLTNKANRKERILIMRTVNLLLIFLFVLVHLTILSGKTFAWFSDPKINSVVAPKTVSQLDQKLIPDGTGGAIITWAEQLNGTGSIEFDIFAQRIDSHGNPVWPSPVAV